MLLASSNASELAKVGDVVISDADFMNMAGMLTEYDRKHLDRERFLNRLIDEELILREAHKMNFHEKEDYRLKVEMYKRQLLVDLYLQQYLKERNTEENQKKYFEANKEKYTSPEKVRVSIITVKSEDVAKEVLENALKGEDFSELAKKYLKGYLANKGGDYGFRERKELKKEFADAAFSMKVGEIRGPIKTDEGYSILKLTDHKDVQIATFDAVKKKVAGDYADKLLEEKISELRKAVPIQVDSAGLKDLKIQ